MSPKSPPVVRNIFKFILMVFGLGIIGIVFGGAIAFIMYKIVVVGSSDLWSPIGIIGLMIGHPIGVIIGIALIRKIFHQHGSLLFGIVGSIFGEALILLVTGFLHLYSGILYYPAFFLSAPVFCLVGFYLGEKIHKSSELEDG